MKGIDLNYIYKTGVDDDSPEEKYLTLEHQEFSNFNSKVLGLGDLRKDGVNVSALTAIFDLAGFTSFCDQGEPQLVVPSYLSMFLEWLFSTISEELIVARRESDIVLWGKLPFFAKFLGDGVMFLWNTEGMLRNDIANIIVTLMEVSDKYQSKFLPIAEANFSTVPQKLRCGIARGQVVSLGEGSDFVGPSINLAARLQKLGPLSFAFSNKGLTKDDFDSSVYSNLQLIKTSIRGVGKDELIFARKKETISLSTEDLQDFTLINSV